MGKIYDEYLYIPKHEKICEKVLVTRVAIIVATIIFCLAAMSVSAYAHFSYNVTSKTSTISVSNFEVDVLIDVIDGEGNVIDTINPTTTNNKSFVAEMQSNKTYRITVKHTDESTVKTGFMVISAEGSNESYHTQQIGRNDDGTTKVISFKMEVTAPTKVKFLTNWGTSSYYDAYETNGENPENYIIEGEKISIGFVTANEQSNNENEEKVDINNSDKTSSQQSLTSESNVSEDTSSSENKELIDEINVE